MRIVKIGVFVGMLLMTPILEAQNTPEPRKEPSLLLLEENLEQLSMESEEEYNWKNCPDICKNPSTSIRPQSAS